MLEWYSADVSMVHNLKSALLKMFISFQLAINSNSRIMRFLKMYVYLLEITSICETIHSWSCSESSELGQSYFISCRTSAVWMWIFFSSLRLSAHRNQAEKASLLWGFCIPSLLEVSIPNLCALDNAKDANLTTIRKVCERLDMNVFHYLSRWTSGGWKHHHRIYIADNDRRRHLSMVTTVSCRF